jgi:hypothetical protein
VFSQTKSKKKFQKKFPKKNSKKNFKKKISKKKFQKKIYARENFWGSRPAGLGGVGNAQTVHYYIRRSISRPKKRILYPITIISRRHGARDVKVRTLLPWVYVGAIQRPDIFFF